MIEIHKYDVLTGNELNWIDDDIYFNDGDIEYRHRYLDSLNKFGGKRYYYWYVIIYPFTGVFVCSR